MASREESAAPSDRCPSCGGDAGNNWFDRSICPEPCGSMHTRCVKCGTALDGCPFDVDEEPAAAPVRRSLARRRSLREEYQRILRVQMDAEYLVEELRRRRDGELPRFIDLEHLRQAVEEVRDVRV